METARITLFEIGSVVLDWVMVAGFFGIQAFVATGGIQRFVAI